MSEPKITILERHWTTHITKDDSFDGVGREFPLVRTVAEIEVDTNTHFRQIRVGPSLNLTNAEWWHSVCQRVGPIFVGFPLSFDSGDQADASRLGKMEAKAEYLLDGQGVWLNKQLKMDTANGRHFRKVYANDLALHRTKIFIRQGEHRHLLYGVGRHCRPLRQSKEGFKAEMEQLTVETVTENKFVR